MAGSVVGGGGGSSRKNTRIRNSRLSAVDDEPPRVPKPVGARRVRERTRTDGPLKILDVDLRVVIVAGVVAFVFLYFVISRLVAVESVDREGKLPRVITPFPAPKIMDLPQFQGEHKESLYWGTYRPHLYFGIRARTPRSLLAGLMWIGVKDGRYFIRHVCQDNDDLSTYGWKSHNGRDYGHQLLVDHGMVLDTSFLKSKEKGSGFGGDWAARIEVQRLKTDSNDELLGSGHLFFYVADEDGNALELGTGNFKESDSLLVSGSRLDVGGWQLHLHSKDNLGVHYFGSKTIHMHNLSDLVQDNLAAQARNYGLLQLSDTISQSSNVMFFQLSAKIPFKADVVFVSGTDSGLSRTEDRLNALRGQSLTILLAEKQKDFDKRFEKTFPIAKELGEEEKVVGKAAIGNLLGGVGYFYGQSKIASPSRTANGRRDYVLYWPAELYSAVPSRPFFPRGFLWDEGFHQLLIWRWDVQISLDIIGHWLDLMNVNGWIPREQILGAEALSKVPEEFVMQYPSNGNPPTLFLVLHDLIGGIRKNKFTASEVDEISSFLESASGRLEAWFQWFNTTQSGKVRGSYFWHGRDSTTIRELNPKTLSSGLDDYPRASHPTGDERHLDLRCWMLLAANCLNYMTDILKEHKFNNDYRLTSKLLSEFDYLNELHFDATIGAYFDYGNHTEKVRLVWKEIVAGTNHATREFVREVLEASELRFVPHFGYVSLFPFIMKIIPSDSSILDKQLDIISNKSLLWTPYGLRSLAKTSTMYMKRNTEHDPPYWRGPIWMNMNYLILSALKYYSTEDGPYMERARLIYDELRGNLIRNVVRNYNQTGFLWEQYDQVKGKEYVLSALMPCPSQFRK
ncbi:hypothetical protein MLD38_017040 [Melastoma candidum]|uniref:Uncharacterized protein n=1 Tax=Melastoma candidum TaxID=119954 RepID=A0ACB9QNQ8_9MYRT|nr:hypothetical protein MLD38_017040 [Melastoma candidum]